MYRRVRRPSNHEELLEKLTKEFGIFETYKDAMIFAAALGASKEKSKHFKNSSEPIDYSVFSRNSDNEVLILLLSIFNRDDIEVLSDEFSDERLLIFEEYANAGLNIISQEIKNSTALDGILFLIFHTDLEDEPKEMDFSSILLDLKEK